MEVKRKNVLFGALICVVIVLVAVGLFTGVFHRMKRDAITVQINPEQSVVALTFDDGPNARYTPQVLDILYEQQVPATFFLIGEKFTGNELLIREMAASGHEIGNHTFSHPDLTQLDSRTIQWEIQQTEEKLKEILPDYPMKYVRPPYGRYTEDVQNAIGLPLVLWTIDSGDWEAPHAGYIYTAVVSRIQDGDIIVFHDDNAETVKALEKIILELKKRGFQFATVSQLYEYQSK